MSLPGGGVGGEGRVLWVLQGCGNSEGSVLPARREASSTWTRTPGSGPSLVTSSPHDSTTAVPGPQFPQLENQDDAGSESLPAMVVGIMKMYSHAIESVTWGQAQSTLCGLVQWFSKAWSRGQQSPHHL